MAGEKTIVRALIGWMSEDKGALVLAGNRTKNVSEELQARVRSSRAAVVQRAPFKAADDVLIDPPPVLEAHSEQLRKNEFGAQFLKNGYHVALADLNKLIAVQPYTEFGDPALEIRSVSPGDLPGIAAITLPLGEKKSFPVQYDPATSTWYFTSHDTTLSLVSNWNGMVREGIPGFGFGVAIRPSFFLAAQIGDRCFLTDGYHRALGLLQRGISIVPVLARKINSPQQLGVSGEPFTPDILFGTHPPLLKDYFDNTISGEIRFPRKRKIITIQATELTVLDPD